MLQGPGAGDQNGHFIGTASGASGLSRPQGAKLSSGSNPVHNEEAQLNSQITMNPNMLMSMGPRPLLMPVPQMGCGVPSQVPLSLASLPGGIPQFPLPTLPVAQSNTSISSPMGLTNGVPLMNVNISRSNFLQTMNFDAMTNQATPGYAEDMQTTNNQDDAASEYSQSEKGELMEQRLCVSEPNVDLIEQQQATAQAQLIDRFKQLRQWQASQQEMLMRQQQEQLAMLQEEQSRVQMLLVKQRENQWGGSGVPNPTSNSPSKSPSKKLLHHPQSSLPHAIAQSTLALAKMNRLDGVTQQPSTPPVVKGRPVPNIASGPSTPLEYLEHGNPNLDSDSNTIASGTPMEDGIQRLADTASECSEAVGAGPAYFQSTRGMSEEEKRERVNAGKKYGPPIPFPSVDDDEQMQRPQHFVNKVGTGVVGVQAGQNPIGIPMLHAQGQPALVQHQTHLMQPQSHNLVPNESHLVSASDHVENSENHVLDFRESHQQAPTGNSDDGSIHSEYCSEGYEMQEEEEQEQAEENVDEDVLEEQDEASEEEALDEEEGYNENDEILEKPLDPEDQPVVGAKKTFEQLLEEELQKEEARQRSGTDVASPPRPKEPPKKAFLKRGEGLARFGISGKNRPQDKVTIKGSSKSENQSSRTTRNIVNQSSKQITTGQNKKKVLDQDTGQQKRSTAPAKASPPSKTSPPTSVQCLPRKTQVTSKSSPPLKTNIPSKSSKLQLKPPPARKSASPQKPQSTVALKVPQPEHVISSAQISVTATTVPSVTQMKPKDSTGEISFQRCMKDREKHEEIENEELEEFEILEQFADDNASFLSSVSVVNKVLSEVKKTTAFESDHMSSTRCTQAVSGQFTANPAACNGQHMEPSGGDDPEIDEDDELNTTLQESPSNKQTGHDGQTSNSLTGTLHRKVSQLQSRSPSKGRTTSKSSNVMKGADDSDIWVEFEGNNDGDDDQGDEDTYAFDQSGSSSEEEHSDTDEENEDFNVRDIILHSKSSDNFTQRSIASDQKHSANLQLKEETTRNSSSKSSPEQTAMSSHEQLKEFDDDFEWDDKGQIRDEAQQSRLPNTVNGPIIKTKVFPEQTSASDAASSTTPPTSKLVTKLFPKLKQDKTKKSPITVEQQQQLSNTKQVPVGDGIQSKALRDKLIELEREIDRFKKENANLEALRREREEGLEHLKKEMEEFEKQKAEELQRLQEYKNEEMKKLKKERRVFEQYQKAARALPDKKDREEIESLKKQVRELQDELRYKEQRWTASTSRLRDRLERLESENAELKEEIKLLEKKRLEAWQQKELSGSSKADKKPDSYPHLGLQNTLTGQASNVPNQLTRQLPGSQSVTTSRPVSSLQINKKSVIKVPCDTDGGETVSDVPDAASQAVSELNVTNDESLIMQTVPQAMSRGPGKHMNNSPPEAISASEASVVTSNASRGNMPRKTAFAVNISQTIDKGDEKYEELQHPDGKIERIYTNGAREILFSNGTRKQVSADGQSIIVSFFNGDIKQIMPDQRVIYYYADAQTTHTTYPDGLEIIQFPNKQVEKHYPDGTREITFPDQIIKYLFPTGVEESIFPDGTVIRVERNGDKVMEFPNGQREIHTPQYKRREYPDGTVKTVYPDGRQETRYSSGRIRVKDRDGQVIIDRRV